MRNPLRKLGCGCLVALSILVFVVMAGYQFAKSKVPPWPEKVEGVRMLPDRPALSTITPTNGYHHLRELEDVSFLPVLDALREREGTPPLQPYGGTNVTAFLDAHPEVTNRFRLAAESPFWQVRTMSSATEAVEGVTVSIYLAKLNAWRMDRAAAGGDWEVFGGIVRDQLRVSGGVAKGGTLIPHLVGIASEGIVIDACTEAVSVGDPPGTLLVEIDRWLAEADRNAEPVAEAFRYEWVYSSNWVHGLYSGDIEPEEFDIDLGVFKHARPVLAVVGSTRRQTLAHVEALYSHLIHQAENPGKVSVVESWVEECARHSRYCKVADDPLGRDLAMILVPAVSRVLEDARSQSMRRRALRTVVAIKRHQHAKGALPAGLEDLVPRFLDRVPEDLHAPGGPIRYTTTDSGYGYVLWSVGLDGRDGGGTPTGGEPWFRRGDVLFHPTQRMHENRQGKQEARR